jgi:hypothetical protein
MVAEIWESRTGHWFGQLVDEATGAVRGNLFEAQSRGGVITTMARLQERSPFNFRDRFLPTEF